jgi:DNA-binding CsgD family transcriptional regulator
VQQTVTRAGGRVFGREPEVAALERFFTPADAAGLVLTGGAGVGKTTLWEEGCNAARGLGSRVLAARPSGAETELSFAALVDLFQEIDVDALAGVPAPQRRALEVALFLAEPTGAPPEPTAISAGFLRALRALAGNGPLVVAVDDVQWLDRPSADALVYAARRLQGHPIHFLLARRPGEASELEHALEPGGLQYLDVGPLSIGATRAMLSERLELLLPRRVLRQIVATGQGNPLFMLEIGRLLAERGLPGIGGEIPIPSRVEDLLGLRVAGLPEASRTLLLLTALSGDLTVAQLTAVVDRSAVDDAVGSGLLGIEGDRVRASHPLLAASARMHSSAEERRDLHGALAKVVADSEARARHLALATERPDAELAAAVDAAAAGASARGAAAEAVELAEHALRLTEPDREERTERLLTLAGYLETAGERQRVTDLLEPALDTLPPGGPRVRAWLLLSEGGAIKSYYDHEHHFDNALDESRGDAGLRARVLAVKALNTVAEGVERIPEAEAWAVEALAESSHAGPDVERLALCGLGWARSLRGRSIDDVCERFRAASEAAFTVMDSPEVVAGLRLVWRGELTQARTTLTRFLRLADERGQAVSYAWLRLNMCELGLRTGEWEAVARLLDEWAESADGQLLITATYRRCRALVAAGRGDADEAERWAAPALQDARALGYRWQVLESQRALGIAGLLAYEPARAEEHLRAVWEHTTREGIDEPGAFPVAADLVEALTESRDEGGAAAVTKRLQTLAKQQEHPWGLATAKRCTALLRLASPGYDGEAAAALAEAANDYGNLGLRFDRARSLLTLGRSLRRHRQWGPARRSLEEAATAFDEIASAGWAEHARAELTRIGARKPRADGALTPSEQRVARLAADGLSNKEIAAHLFVTVHTVEVHLSHVYTKLGVRSRGQLAYRLDALR